MLSTISDQTETKKVALSPYQMLTEKDLAYAALEAAKVARDLNGVNAARIWVARIQVEERQARLLLLEHVCDRMAADRIQAKEQGVR